MIRIIADNKIAIEADSVSDITTDDIAKIFRDDPVDDVLLTYVVTTEPTSRRKVAEDSVG